MKPGVKSDVKHYEIFVYDIFLGKLKLVEEVAFRIYVHIVHQFVLVSPTAQHSVIHLVFQRSTRILRHTGTCCSDHHFFT